MKKQPIIVGIVILITYVGFSGCNELVKDNEQSKSESLPPVIKSFYATPNDIEEGEIVTLYWEVSNATSIHIDNGIGEIKLHGDNGEYILTPTTNTTYRLTAENSYSSISESIQVIVKGNSETEVNRTFIGSSSAYMYGEWFCNKFFKDYPSGTACSFGATAGGGLPDNFDGKLYTQYLAEGIGFLTKHGIDNEYNYFICEWNVKKAENGIVVGDIDSNSIDPFSNTKIYFSIMNPTGQHDFFYNANENIRDVKILITSENIGQWDFDFWYWGIDFDAVVTYNIYLIKTVNTDKVDFNKFVGTWLGEDGITRTYYSNGTAENSIEGYAGTWKIENGKHLFTNTNGDVSIWDYTFYADGATLRLTSEYGISTDMTKQ